MYRYAVLAANEKISADRKVTRDEKENGKNACFGPTIIFASHGKYKTLHDISDTACIPCRRIYVMTRCPSVCLSPARCIVVSGVPAFVA